MNELRIGLTNFHIRTGGWFKRQTLIRNLPSKNLRSDTKCYDIGYKHVAWIQNQPRNWNPIRTRRIKPQLSNGIWPKHTQGWKNQDYQLKVDRHTKEIRDKINQNVPIQEQNKENLSKSVYTQMKYSKLTEYST